MGVMNNTVISRQLTIGKYLSMCFCLLLFSLNTFAQGNDEVSKSKKVETIGGRKFFIHTVEKGQTLYNIARGYSIGVNDLVLNNPETIDGIKPGQVLKIPVEKPKKKEEIIAVSDTGQFIMHKVQQGQTLYSLSKQYNVGIDAIIAVNPGTAAGVKAGQMLKIPKVIAAPQPPWKKTDPITLKTSDSLKAPVVDSLILLDSATAFKPVYNIALFLPFHTEIASLINTDKIEKGEEEFPAKSSLALEFYSGIKAAADSLSEKGFSAKFYLYDTEKDSSALNNFLKKPEFDNIHLIIGPLYASNFTKISTFAKLKNIPIISPLTLYNKILFENPYVHKLTPSITAQVEQICSYVTSIYSKENIILINNFNVRDSSFINSARKILKAGLLSKHSSRADTIKEFKAFEDLPLLLSKEKTNIVVIPSTGQVHVTNTLTQLNSLRDKYRIIVFGMQPWISYDNLDIEYLNNLNVHLPSPTHVDFENDTVKKFIVNYRTEYFSDPTTFAFHGYDAGVYYFTALKTHGLNFQYKITDIFHRGLQTCFSLRREIVGSGLENKCVHIIKYQDYKLVKVK